MLRKERSEPSQAIQPITFTFLLPQIEFMKFVGYERRAPSPQKDIPFRCFINSSITFFLWFSLVFIKEETSCGRESIMNEVVSEIESVS
jgi:hypothetical protein